MTTSLIETSEGKVEYTSLGNGRPMLIIVGGHTNCKETIFHKGLDPDKFRFITPSRPGYGLTPLTEQNKTPKGTSDLFAALLDELNIQKAIVVGISAGGLTALEIAANYPDRVENLILMSALTKKWLVETDKVYKGAKRIFTPKIEPITWLFYRLFFRLCPNLMTRTMFKQLSTFRPVQFTKHEFQELKQMSLIMRSYKGFDNDLDQTIDQETLKTIECPTLILHSENDNSVDISHAQNAKDKIKDSKLVTFNNHWGHLLWLGTDYDPILKVLKQQIEHTTTATEKTTPLPKSLGLRN
jgi:pimeloyl-ACP methyl ester carboxylesterase